MRKNPLHWTKAAYSDLKWTGTEGCVIAMRVLLFFFLAFPSPQGVENEALQAGDLRTLGERKAKDRDAFDFSNLAVANLPASMASETTIVIPSNGANIIQMAPGLPSVALQASGAIPSQYMAQQLGISTSGPQQVPQGNPLERFLKAEPKVLGTVEILIGLIHIGFGAVSLSSLDSRTIYPCLTATRGYPFWGGIFFISSGSLCAAASRPTHPLVRNLCII
ncbi:hypothetical protein E2320_020879 [Naja naja]|nr:hypothetical protein E2320_020879 [Naja naja]